MLIIMHIFSPKLALFTYSTSNNPTEFCRVPSLPGGHLPMMPDAGQILHILFRGRRQGRQPLNIYIYICTALHRQCTLYIHLSSTHTHIYMSIYIYILYIYIFIIYIYIYLLYIYIYLLYIYYIYIYLLYITYKTNYLHMHNVDVSTYMDNIWGVPEMGLPNNGWLISWKISSRNGW